MKRNYKIAISILPFAVAAAITFGLTSGLMTQDKAKSDELATQQAAYDVIQAKLKQRSTAESEKRNLETQIETLRGSVPKTPEVELALLDLEKMCNQSDVDLVGVETPSSESLKENGATEDEIKSLTSADKIDDSKQQNKTAAPANAPAKIPSAAETTGLRRLVKQVYVTGNYNGMVSLMKKLETYQRVVTISNIAIAQKLDNSATTERNLAYEKAQRLNLKQPLMTFLMTLYYVP